MTTLTNTLLEQALRGREGWIKAQQETIQMQEDSSEYRAK